MIENQLMDRLGSEPHTEHRLTRLEHSIRCASSTDGVKRTGSAVSAQTSKKLLVPQLTPACPSARMSAGPPMAAPAGRTAVGCCCGVVAMRSSSLAEVRPGGCMSRALSAADQSVALSTGAPA